MNPDTIVIIGLTFMVLSPLMGALVGLLYERKRP